MKRIKAEKLRKRLFKVVKLEYEGDGLYLDIYNIDNFFVDNDYKNGLITVKGAYGRYEADGNNNFHLLFELNFYKNCSKSLEFVDGMFYQIITRGQTEQEE